MKTSMMAAALVAVLGAAAITAPTEAEARRGGPFAAGVIGGLSAGAIIASAGYPYYGAYPSYGYGYYPTYPVYPAKAGPAYYGPPPGCVISRQRVFDGYAWHWQKLRVCH